VKEQIFKILNERGIGWSFSDLNIKLSPHTPAIVVREIVKEGDVWMLKWNNGYGPASMPLSMVEHRETLATVYQRLMIQKNGSTVTD
jgi:hypothetical protein